MPNSLKITIALVIMALAVNIFLWNHNSIKRSDLFGSAQSQDNRAEAKQPESNVSLEEDKQIIVINAKGGYIPENTKAKSGVPTTLKIVTKNTFDCSSSLSIPDLKYEKNLPASGETLIDIPAQAKGTVLKGTCSMGMYGFSILFE